MSELSTKIQPADDHSEIKLLLCCTRISIDAERANRINSLLQSDLDWAYVIRIADQHGLMPLLYHSLKTAWAKAVPKTILEQLEHHFQSNAQRNSYLTAALLDLFAVA